MERVKFFYWSSFDLFVVKILSCCHFCCPTVPLVYFIKVVLIILDSIEFV